MYRFMSDIVQITICFFLSHLAISCIQSNPAISKSQGSHCLKHSKTLGIRSKLIQILGDGNCLFRALSYTVTGRQI